MATKAERDRLVTMSGMGRKKKAPRKQSGKGILQEIGKVLKEAKVGSLLASKIPKIGNIAGPLVKSLGYGKKKRKSKKQKGRGLLADLAGLIPVVGGPLKVLGNHFGFGKQVPAGQYISDKTTRSSRFGKPYMDTHGGAGKSRQKGGLYGPDPSSIPIHGGVNGNYVSYGGIRM